MDFATFQSFLLTVAVIAGVVGYWRKGGNTASVEVLTTLKLQVETQKEEIISLQEAHRENLGEIGKLKGIIEEKDKRLAVLEQIAQGRDPKTLEMLNYISSVSKNSEIFMANSVDREQKILTALQQISSFIGQINNHFATHSVSSVNA